MRVFHFYGKRFDKVLDNSSLRVLKFGVSILEGGYLLSKGFDKGSIFCWLGRQLSQKTKRSVMGILLFFRGRQKSR